MAHAAAELVGHVGQEHRRHDVVREDERLVARRSLDFDERLDQPPAHPERQAEEERGNHTDHEVAVCDTGRFAELQDATASEAADRTEEDERDGEDRCEDGGDVWYQGNLRYLCAKTSSCFLLFRKY